MKQKYIFPALLLLWTGRQVVRFGVTREATPFPTCSINKLSPTMAQPALMIMTITALVNGITRRTTPKLQLPMIIGTPSSLTTRKITSRWRVLLLPVSEVCRC